MSGLQDHVEEISEHKAKDQKMKIMKVGVLRNNSGSQEVPWKAADATERDQPLKAQTESKDQLCHLPAKCQWISHDTPPGLSFSSCEMGWVITATSQSHSED